MTQAEVGVLHSNVGHLPVGDRDSSEPLERAFRLVVENRGCRVPAAARVLVNEFGVVFALRHQACRPSWLLGEAEEAARDGAEKDGRNSRSDIG